MTSNVHYPSSVANVLGILGNKRRVLLLNYLFLFGYEQGIEVRHLARVIGGVENGISPREVTTEDYESVYNGLIQNHLPKLAKYDIIDYDDRAKVVTVTPRIEEYVILIVIARIISPNR
ncbi:DUF7344 domain-containing protein [Natronoarchaeum rubrum]|uniref:DUF7344 domain-containing protein n=1 Tax=Natronoarchaeum rubrum TaxID=755311 RepID=UPI004046FE7C